MLTIDGSHGEGGGQVLRTALTLSAITGRPIHIEHIRAGRKKPGLRPQHLTAARAAAAICAAQLQGDELGSQTLAFVPNDAPRPGEYVFDVTDAALGGSAGSVGLVLQTILLPLALADGESRVTLKGGTHVPWAPPVPYLEHVFLPTLAQMSIHAQLELARWGFYPAGGGQLVAQIAGREKSLRPLQLVERGELQRIWGTAAVTNLPAHIAQRMAARARNVLLQAGLQSHVEPRRLRGSGPGAGIFVFAEYEFGNAGFTAYGKKGLPAERVAETACGELLDHYRSGQPVDPHLADQLVVPMALAENGSRIVTSQITQHLLTNIWVTRQFVTRDMHVEGELGTAGTITVKAAAPSKPTRLK